MNFDALFEARLHALRAEGRYRVFADLERRCGQFPRAYDYRVGAEVTVWCSNDYLGMGQHPAVLARPLASWAGLRRTCTVVQISRGRSRRQIFTRLTIGGRAHGVPVATCAKKTHACRTPGNRGPLQIPGPRARIRAACSTTTTGASLRWNRPAKNDPRGAARLVLSFIDRKNPSPTAVTVKEFKHPALLLRDGGTRRCPIDDHTGSDNPSARSAMRLRMTAGSFADPRDRFVGDSALERGGFDPSVLLAI
jgi:hypothetical protein